MPQDSLLYLVMTKLLFLTIGAGVAAVIVLIIGLALQSTLPDE